MRSRGVQHEDQRGNHGVPNRFALGAVCESCCAKCAGSVVGTTVKSCFAEVGNASDHHARTMGYIPIQESSILLVRPRLVGYLLCDLVSLCSVCQRIVRQVTGPEIGSCFGVL